jgi:hypothetical protein
MNPLYGGYFKIVIIFICIGFTAFTLNQYAEIIQHLISIKYDWQFELLIVTGMLFFQYPFIYKVACSLKFDYYLNMLIVSLAGSLLLWPLLLINYFYHCSDAVNIIYFFAVVIAIFFEHKRRVAKLLLPVYISYTWILYRLLILIFIW